MVVFSFAGFILIGFHAFLAISVIFKFLKQESKIIKKILSDFESREKKKNQQEILNFSLELVRKNSRVKALYQRLVSCPRNGSPDQRIQRSYVLKELLRITQSIEVTSMILFLAEKEGRRILKVSSDKSKMTRM